MHISMCVYIYSVYIYVMYKVWFLPSHDVIATYVLSNSSRRVYIIVRSVKYTYNRNILKLQSFMELRRISCPRRD